MIRNNKIILGMLTGSMAVNLCSVSTAFGAEQNTEAKFTIEDGVLTGAKNLSGEVTLPDNITSIGKHAFKESSFKDVTNIIIPGNVKKVENLAFQAAGENLQAVHIKEGVKEIGNQAFADCYDLKTVTLPSSLSKIGCEAFGCCDSLTEITIPDKVTKLNGLTFDCCSNLKKVNMSSKLVDFNESDFSDTQWIDDLTANNNGLGICNDILFTTSRDISGSITIPSNVKKIKSKAFYECQNITSIIIPDSVSVTEIPEDTFCYCTSLKSVKLSKNIEKIDERAFEDCMSLENITLPKNLKTIGKFAFLGCSKLTSVEIPASVTSIDEGAFADNVNFTGKGSNLDDLIKDMKARKGDSYSDDINFNKKPNGWFTIDGHKYYKNSANGDMQKGWLDLDGKKYYFYNNGWQATGFIKLSDTAYYYCDPSTGELLTGWKYIDNKWYYFNPSASGDKEKGWMQTGWLYNNGGWYYFYSDGTMATGFINPTGDEYYFLEESSSSSIGSMKTGWQSLYGSWYYFNKSSDGTEGLMSKGWKKINGTWYYFYYGDGKMAANTWIDGYHVNASGAWDR